MFLSSSPRFNKDSSCKGRAWYMAQMGQFCSPEAAFHVHSTQFKYNGECQAPENGLSPRSYLVGFSAYGDRIQTPLAEWYSPSIYSSIALENLPLFSAMLTLMISLSYVSKWMEQWKWWNPLLSLLSICSEVISWQSWEYSLSFRHFCWTTVFRFTLSFSNPHPATDMGLTCCYQ